jgi:acetylornithine deacetylase/succinyl-diaminopimelate desuccinylase-like protein
MLAEDTQEPMRLIDYAGIPTNSIGPSGATAHMVDEHVEIDDLVNATKALALVIARRCGVIQASMRAR